MLRFDIFHFQVSKMRFRPHQQILANFGLKHQLFCQSTGHRMSNVFPKSGHNPPTLDGHCQQDEQTHGLMMFVP